MTFNHAKCNWNKECQKEFDTIKKSASRQPLLSYPNFNNSFVIQKNRSKVQLGEVISKGDKLIACYRINYLAKVDYTTNKHKLLFIVETLKEFINILLARQNKVYAAIH